MMKSWHTPENNPPYIRRMLPWQLLDDYGEGGGGSGYGDDDSDYGQGALSTPLPPVLPILIGETSGGVDIIREVNTEDISRMSKEQFSERYGSRAANVVYDADVYSVALNGRTVYAPRPWAEYMAVTKPQREQRRLLEGTPIGPTSPHASPSGGGVQTGFTQGEMGGLRGLGFSSRGAVQVVWRESVPLESIYADIRRGGGPRGPMTSTFSEKEREQLLGIPEYELGGFLGGRATRPRADATKSLLRSKGVGRLQIARFGETPESLGGLVPQSAMESRALLQKITSQEIGLLRAEFGKQVGYAGIFGFAGVSRGFGSTYGSVGKAANRLVYGKEIKAFQSEFKFGGKLGDIVVGVIPSKGGRSVTIRGELPSTRGRQSIFDIRGKMDDILVGVKMPSILFSVDKSRLNAPGLSKLLDTGSGRGAPSAQQRLADVKADIYDFYKGESIRGKYHPSTEYQLKGIMKSETVKRRTPLRFTEPKDRGVIIELGGGQVGLLKTEQKSEKTSTLMGREVIQELQRLTRRQGIEAGYEEDEVMEFSKLMKAEVSQMRKVLDDVSTGSLDKTIVSLIMDEKTRQKTRQKTGLISRLATRQKTELISRLATKLISRVALRRELKQVGAIRTRQRVRSRQRTDTIGKQVMDAVNAVKQDLKNSSRPRSGRRRGEKMVKWPAGGDDELLGGRGRRRTWAGFGYSEKHNPLKEARKFLMEGLNTRKNKKRR